MKSNIEGVANGIFSPMKPTSCGNQNHRIVRENMLEEKNRPPRSIGNGSVR
jgi:hypothetical protein